MNQLVPAIRPLGRCSRLHSGVVFGAACNKGVSSGLTALCSRLRSLLPRQSYELGRPARSGDRIYVFLGKRPEDTPQLPCPGTFLASASALITAARTQSIFWERTRYGWPVRDEGGDGRGKAARCPTCAESSATCSNVPGDAGQDGRGGVGPPTVSVQNAGTVEYCDSSNRHG